MAHPPAWGLKHEAQRKLNVTLRVRLGTGDLPEGRSALMGGSSFYSQNDLALFFGLGKAAMVDHIEVRWPSGAVERWEHVAAN